MAENMEIWNALKRPPKGALKPIKAGRLKGMTDISPQWRYKAITEKFGPVGFGWKPEIVDLWIDEGSDGVRVANARVNLFVKRGEEWSEPIQGVGGSMFVAKESKGLYTSDEAFKMAVTDAISTAAKLLGVGGDIYLGRWDGRNYSADPNAPAPPKELKPGTKLWANAIAAYRRDGNLDAVKKHVTISAENEKKLIDEANTPEPGSEG